MAEFKLIISDPKTGKSEKKELNDEQSAVFLGKSIGDKVQGDSFEYPEFEFEITGGSDNAGFAMRKGIKGNSRKKILTKKGVGFKGKNRFKQTQSGLRKKKTVCGQTIGSEIVQINLKTTKQGKKPEPKKEEAPQETTKEEKKEEKK